MGKKKRMKKAEVFLFIVVVGLLVGMIQYKKLSLEQKLAHAIERKKYAAELLEEEKRRGEELEHLEVDCKTRKFIEDIAREKFGLSYENEIIFEPEE